MARVLPKLLTFEEFLVWYPEDGRRYELIEGEISEQIISDVRNRVTVFEHRRQDLYKLN